MDILSLSKANNALKNINQLDDDVVAPLAEDRFPTVDARLDWLKEQASKIKAENSFQVDLSKGTFHNTEFVYDRIQLKKIGQISDVEYITNTETETFGPTTNQNFTYNYTFESKEPLSERTRIAISLSFKSTGTTVKTTYIIINGVRYDGSYYNGAIPNIKEQKNIRIQFYVGTLSGYSPYTITTRIDKVTEKQYIQDQYIYQGSYISPIINLGEGWHETKLINVVKQIKSSITDCTLEVSTSADGISFSEYTSLNPEDPPQGRYIKFLATLTAQGQSNETVTHVFDQSEENKVTLNDYVIADSDLKLKTDFTYEGNRIFEEGNFKIIQTPIPASNFKRISKLEEK